MEEYFNYSELMLNPSTIKILIFILIFFISLTIIYSIIKFISYLNTSKRNKNIERKINEIDKKLSYIINYIDNNKTSND